MATKKPAAPAAKPKKSTSTALTLWEQEMAGAAEEQKVTENVTGGFKSISLKSGILSVDDNSVEGNELRVVILAACHENQLYAGDYDPNTPTTPICYAFGKTDKDMAPHAEAPEKQGDSCEGCPHNEWGSAEKGRGKACKNVRRLICVTEDALESAEAMEEAEARMMKLPVTSVKNWSAYVQNILPEFRRPSYGVVTRIKVVPDAKSQFKVQFHFEELIDFDVDGLYDALKKKVAESEKNIANAYPVFDEEPAPPQRGRGRTIPIKQAPAAKGKAPVKRSKY